MNLKSLSRRGILRLGGGSALGAVMADAGTSMGRASGALLPNAPETVGVPSMPSLAEQAARKLMGDTEADFSTLDRYRINGLDPDIHVLRSVSPVIKARMQLSRDRRKQSILNRLRRMAGYHYY